jgi:hypothetical protein
MARSARAASRDLAAVPRRPHPRSPPGSRAGPRAPSPTTCHGTVAIRDQHHGYDEQYPTSAEKMGTIVTSGRATSGTVGRVTTRNPQPEAVAAARQMLEPRVQSIADLAHAHDLLAQRRAEATAAETALTHAVTGYAERYATARRAHGWTPAELGELGFPHNRPATHRTRTHRRRTTPTSPTNPTNPPPPATPGPAVGDDRTPRPTDPHAEGGTAGHRRAPTPHTATGAPPTTTAPA